VLPFTAASASSRNWTKVQLPARSLGPIIPARDPGQARVRLALAHSRACRFVCAFTASAAILGKKAGGLGRAGVLNLLSGFLPTAQVFCRGRIEIGKNDKRKVAQTRLGICYERSAYS
jgi:hypothetical protein